MATRAPAATRWTARKYLRLVDRGVLGPDDRVELLSGVIVSMAPEGPRHAAVVDKVADALRHALDGRAAVRVQHPLHASVWSVPEPDVAVVAGTHDDYLDAHPKDALLVVEVSDDGVGGAGQTAAGTGLAGLTDRIAALDGELVVTSPPGEGTTLHATVPLR